MPCCRPFRLSACLAAALTCLAVAAPAEARTWGGTRASPGAALHAKALGLQCKVLNAAEIAEIDGYLARVAVDYKNNPAKRDFDFEKFKRELLAAYMLVVHNDCGPDGIEEAHDTLKRIRTAMATGKLYEE